MKVTKNMSILVEDIQRWKYRLCTTHKRKLDMPLKLRPKKKIGIGSKPQSNDFVEYDPESDILTVYSGYCWDGPSGPTIDTKATFRPSLYHDALYQLIREGCFSDDSAAQLFADQVYRDALIENGVSKFRAGYHYLALRLKGKSSRERGTQKELTFTAP